VTYTPLQGDVRFWTTWTSAMSRASPSCTISRSIREAGPEGRLRRRDRRGQDDDHQPDQPLLRHRRRQDPLRRHQHQQDPKADLRRSLGIVLQDVNLFTGTVMENIRYGKLDATDERVHRRRQARQRRRLHHALPDGYRRC
jgi:hypothetical protein